MVAREVVITIESLKTKISQRACCCALASAGVILDILRSTPKSVVNIARSKKQVHLSYSVTAPPDRGSTPKFGTNYVGTS